MKDSIKIEREALYYCIRCKLNSLGEQMCPCPRGGCEAKIIGEKTVVTTIKLIESKKSF